MHNVQNCDSYGKQGSVVATCSFSTHNMSQYKTGFPSLQYFRKRLSHSTLQMSNISNVN
jgi:hypothetical protein